MQHLINLEVVLGDASVLPPDRQSQLHQVKKQLGLVSHLWMVVVQIH